MPSLATSGYLKRRCDSCGKTIYLKEDRDGVWRPYASWSDGQVDAGVWQLHECRSHSFKPRAHAVDSPQSTSVAAPTLIDTVAEIRDRFDLPDVVAVEIIALVARVIRSGGC
jgi:hypothetical protein